jgi:hypothetical protein
MGTSSMVWSGRMRQQGSKGKKRAKGHRASGLHAPRSTAKPHSRANSYQTPLSHAFQAYRHANLPLAP